MAIKNLAVCFSTWFVCFVFGWAGQVAADSDKLFHKNLIQDATSVPEAIDAIRSVLELQGFEIIGVVDHAAGAASVGMALRPTQLLLFSDKRLENKLIRNEKMLAIDFPLKLLVWESADGSIQHFYNGPGYLIDRHQLRIHEHRMAEVSKALSQFGALDGGLITVGSPFTVDQTIENLKNIIEGLADNGFRIPFVIDFESRNRHAAHETGNSSSAMLLVFGNPNVGTPLMQSQQRIGIDLPQKFLVWEDRYNQTNITIDFS